MNNPDIALPSILVIDDEQGLRDMLTFGLTDRGYRVVTAATGEEGLEKAGCEEVDLVVTDIMMPGISGVEVLKELKKIQPKAEVIMATGCATLETAVESMKLGAYDYISKPYGLDQLCVLLGKALEHRRLTAKVGQLEELNRLKSEFLANMSHELRTPMNAILGYTSLLLEKAYGDISAKQEQGLKRIDINAKNLLQLINNILDFSKLAAGRMTLYRESCDLREIVDEVMATVECLAHERNLTLTADVQETTQLLTDKTKLKQVLINLIGNAIKFTQRGGVTLRTEVLTGPARVRLSVQDTGIGIKPDDRALLFEDFKQLDASQTREYGGTGLGLSITKKLVELFGGAVRVQSTPGVGSTFIVTLPLESGTVAEALPVGKAVDAVQGQKVILSIDDDPEVLALLADSLQGTGFKSISAQNGQEGLALARQLHPYAITLDIMMPHMDGWTVLQHLKSDPATRTIPVFILSITENKALGFSLGVTDYIIKPFDRSDLLSKLKECDTTGPHRVLLVDDDPQIIRLFQEAIRHKGYQVDFALSGDEALAKMTAHKPDFLFLDLMMPQRSGFDVLEVIEKTPALSGMRVFAMTASDLSCEEKAYLEQRVEMIVKKESRSLAETLSSLKKKLSSITETVLP
jgi:signal transduction histidine kinase